MAALAQPFVNAINNNQIEGVLFEGRSKDGKSYSKALGNRTLPDGTKKPLESSNLLFLASATKLLTSIAALQCCEQGRLSLDADLSSELSKVVNLGVLTGWEEGAKEGKFEPLKNPVTLRHLITHSSGLVYDFLDPKSQRWRASNPVEKDGVGVEGRWAAPFAFQPGEGWMYGTGLDWAGLVVERATGMNLDEYFRKHIFAPVGVSEKDISFFPVGEGQGDRMPDLNPKDPKGLGLSAAMGSSLHDEIPGACYGGGGAYASAEAYIAVLQSLLFNDGKILSKESVEEMFKPQLEPAAKASIAEKMAGPFGPYMNLGTSGKHPNYGLGGLLVTEDDANGLMKGTLTWGGGINTAWHIDPASGICGFMSSQLGIPGDAVKNLELKQVFRKHLKDALA